MNSIDDETCAEEDFFVWTGSNAIGTGNPLHELGASAPVIDSRRAIDSRPAGTVRRGMGIVGASGIRHAADDLRKVGN